MIMGLCHFDGFIWKDSSAESPSSHQNLTLSDKSELERKALKVENSKLEQLSKISRLQIRNTQLMDAFYLDFQLTRIFLAIEICTIPINLDVMNLKKFGLIYVGFSINPLVC